MAAELEITLDPTAAAYIEVIVTGIVTRVLDRFETADELELWVTQETPWPLSDRISEELSSDLTYNLQMIANQVRTYLEEKGRDDVYQGQLGSRIFPWDILGGILEPDVDRVVPEFFFGDETYGDSGHKLPVQFGNGIRSFEHDLTDEFAFGILLFAHAAELPIDATMFGEPLDYFNAVNDRFNSPRTPYAIEVDGRDYHFYHLDFLQGFKTGALWVGVNHQDYWRNLRVVNLATGITGQLRFD